MKQVPIAGFKVAVANVGGTFYVFGDTCTHRKMFALQR
jgi:nitrite reductase/ring-hydroxylating ferredoxin subunit